MTEFIGKDGSGKDILRFIEYDGLIYTQSVVQHMGNGGLKEQVEACRHLEVRDDDIFIPAFMKSGTHWLWDIVQMLLNKTTRFVPAHKESFMVDHAPTEKLASLPSPRLLNMHLPLKYFPPEAIKKKCKILHVMRNPKDIFVSYFSQCQVLPILGHVDSFSNFLPMMLGENGFYLQFAWHEYELAWEKFGKDNPGYPIMYLYYEDLKEDLEKWVRKIAKFLELDVSEELIRGIAERCQIEKHREGYLKEKENHFLKDMKIDGNPVMFRKGVVGDWKNWFTVADNERMDEWIATHMKDTNLKFRYEL